MKGKAQMEAAFHHAKVGVKVTHSKDGKTTGTFQPRTWPAHGGPAKSVSRPQPSQPRVGAIRGAKDAPRPGNRR